MIAEPDADEAAQDEQTDQADQEIGRMKKVNGMLTMPVPTHRNGPMGLGMTSTTLAAMASAILVSDGIPVKTPAAKTSPMTAWTFPACRYSSAF